MKQENSSMDAFVYVFSSREYMAHRFHPQNADRLLSEERMQMIPPPHVIAHLRIETGHKVADVGAGPGFFAIPIARHTGATVYGIDVEPQMLTLLSERAKTEQVELQTMEASAESIPLPAKSVDRTLCAFVLHEVPNPTAALMEFKRITASGGFVGIVEWEKKATRHGPPISERLGRDELTEKLQQAGLNPQEWVDLNEDQYLCVCGVLD